MHLKRLSIFILLLLFNISCFNDLGVINEKNAVILYSSIAKKNTAPHVGPGGQIIADHTIVSQYNQIPQYWIDEVKKMWVNILGESHSAAYREGLVALMDQDSKFAVAVTASGSPGTGTTALRASNTRSSLSGTWTGGAGEAVWYTWYAWSPWGADKDIIKDHVQYCRNQDLDLSVIGFGWCWDMSWSKGPSVGTDPAYNVRWYGSSEGGPDEAITSGWGLDAGDYSLTNNRVSMDTYLNATNEYIAYSRSINCETKVIFTTGPVDGYTGENGYQRHLKHEYIRSFVRADSNRILFDYADILCYDDNGNQTTTTWDSHTYPVITPTNLGDASVGHIGSAGAVRLAKAQWWMLARIAGWDGVSP
jgi:hypothetical protein